MESTNPSILPVEWWGGLECTINRVGDHYFDQLSRSNHYARLPDLDRFAELGIRTLRYPVLWEKVAPDAPDQTDWHWADASLHQLRKLNVRVVAGLVHHGSGPRYATLDNPAFAEGLARYARSVAARYPWIDAYTPVNEPLTTARFCGLYGHWYPHRRDDLSFARMLLNQCRATVLAMREIRKIQPAAQLVQTEDFGQTHSLPSLSYQADFENERRWLTFDLLCGKVDQQHPMWNYFRWVGIPETELAFFLENPCPPDVLGINHYVTSERYLDERLENYPPHQYGGNHRHRYVDTEAVRIPQVTPAGPYKLFTQVWERYRLPVAITEVHLGCTREEQMRWLTQIWQAASQLKAAGADVRGVTAWALLGSFDWDCLLTQQRDCYEPGVFDLRSPEPRPTALARLIRQTGTLTHPVVAGKGWWQQNHHKLSKETSGNRLERPLLITGATGTLGQAFARICTQRGLSYHLLNRQELDITDENTVSQIVRKMQPWAVINTAGYVRVAQAEEEPERCYRENVTGAVHLATVCSQLGIPLLTFSTDLVFDGTKRQPYVESDPVCPTTVYGSSKAEAERRVQAILSSALIIRTSAFFSPWDAYNFVTLLIRAFQSGNPFDAAHAQVSPTYVPDLVHNCLDLLIDGETGIWHLTNTGAVTWAEFGRQAALRAGIDPVLVEAWHQMQTGQIAGKPLLSTALLSERANLMPSLATALARYTNETTHMVQEPNWL